MSVPVTVEGLIERASRLTDAEATDLAEAWIRVDDSVYGAAMDAVHEAVPYEERWGIWEKVWGAAPWGTRGSVIGAALALTFRDRISEEHFQALYGPWASVMGR